MTKKHFSRLEKAEIFNFLNQKGFSIYEIGELSLFGIKNPSHIARYIRELNKIADSWLNKEGYKDRTAQLVGILRAIDGKSPRKQQRHETSNQYNLPFGLENN